MFFLFVKVDHSTIKRMVFLHEYFTHLAHERQREQMDRLISLILNWKNGKPEILERDDLLADFQNSMIQLSNGDSKN